MNKQTMTVCMMVLGIIVASTKVCSASVTEKERRNIEPNVESKIQLLKRKFNEDLEKNNEIKDMVWGNVMDYGDIEGVKISSEAKKVEQVTEVSFSENDVELKNLQNFMAGIKKRLGEMKKKKKKKDQRGKKGKRVEVLNPEKVMTVTTEELGANKMIYVVERLNEDDKERVSFMEAIARGDAEKLIEVIAKAKKVGDEREIMRVNKKDDSSMWGRIEWEEARKEIVKLVNLAVNSGGYKDKEYSSIEITGKVANSFVVAGKGMLEIITLAEKAKVFEKDLEKKELLAMIKEAVEKEEKESKGEEIPKGMACEGVIKKIQDQFEKDAKPLQGSEIKNNIIRVKNIIKSDSVIKNDEKKGNYDSLERGGTGIAMTLELNIRLLKTKVEISKIIKRKYTDFLEMVRSVEQIKGMMKGIEGKFAEKLGPITDQWKEMEQLIGKLEVLQEKYKFKPFSPPEGKIIEDRTQEEEEKVTEEVEFFIDNMEGEIGGLGISEGEDEKVSGQTANKLYQLRRDCEIKVKEIEGRVSEVEGRQYKYAEKSSKQERDIQIAKLQRYKQKIGELKREIEKKEKGMAKRVEEKKEEGEEDKQNNHISKWSEIREKTTRELESERIKYDGWKEETRIEEEKESKGGKDKELEEMIRLEKLQENAFDMVGSKRVIESILEKIKSTKTELQEGGRENEKVETEKMAKEVESLREELNQLYIKNDKIISAILERQIGRLTDGKSSGEVRDEMKKQNDNTENSENKNQKVAKSTKKLETINEKIKPINSVFEGGQAESGMEGLRTKVDEVNESLENGRKEVEVLLKIVEVDEIEQVEKLKKQYEGAVTSLNSLKERAKKKVVKEEEVVDIIKVNKENSIVENGTAGGGMNWGGTTVSKSKKGKKGEKKRSKSKKKKQKKAKKGKKGVN